VESLIVLRHKLLYAVIPGPRALGSALRAVRAQATRAEPGIHNHWSSSCDTAHPPHFLGLWIPGSLASRQNRLASAPEWRPGATYDTVQLPNRSYGRPASRISDDWG